MKRLMRWLKQWLGIAEQEQRIADLERHFVTKRGPSGEVTETLADVPLEKRKERAAKPKGMSIQQRKEFLERTDGMRRM